MLYQMSQQSNIFISYRLEKCHMQWFMESEATVVLFLLDKLDNIFPKKYIPFKDVKSKITIAKQLPLGYSIV